MRHPAPLARTRQFVSFHATIPSPKAGRRRHVAPVIVCSPMCRNGARERGRGSADVFNRQRVQVEQARTTVPSPDGRSSAASGASRPVLPFFRKHKIIRLSTVSSNVEIRTDAHRIWDFKTLKGRVCAA